MGKVLKVISIILMFLLTMFILSIKVEAANIVSTDKKVESGSGNVTITVTSKQPLGAYKMQLTDSAGLEIVSADGGQVSGDKKTITNSVATGTTSLGSYTFKVPEVDSTKTYNINFYISGMETIDLESVESENNIAVLTVNAKEQQPVVTPEPPQAQPQQQTPVVSEPSKEPEKKSSNADLSTLGITPKEYDFNDFKASKTEYNVTIPYSVENVGVGFGKADTKSKVSITGNKNLKVGANKVTVKVTAEDGTVKTYTINVLRQEQTAEETENQEDKKNEDDTNAQDEQQTTGEENNNENQENQTNIVGLKSLTINDVILTPEFSSDVYEYSATLKKDKTSVEITAIAANSEDTVTIAGNENLKDGDNLISIIIYDKDSNVVASYHITLNKNLNTIITETVGGVDNLTKYFIIAISVLAVIAVILLIVIIRTGKKEDDEDRMPKVFAEKKEKVEIEKEERHTEEKKEQKTARKKKGKHF